MVLTGKCKEDFEKWFSTNEENEKGLLTFQVNIARQKNISLFYRLEPAMQYGVLVDFFDGFEIEIITRKNYWNVKTYPGHRHKGYSAFTKTRSEARTEAIKKANELFNEKFK